MRKQYKVLLEITMVLGCVLLSTGCSPESLSKIKCQSVDIGSNKQHFNFSNTYGGQGWDSGRSILSCEKGYVIGGWTNNSFTDSTDFFIGKINESGSPEWVTVLGGRNKDQFYNFIGDEQNGFTLLGHSWSFFFTFLSGGPREPRPLVVKIDKNRLLWSKEYNGKDYLELSNLINVSTSNTAYAGFSVSSANQYRINYLVLDGNGTPLSSKVYEAEKSVQGETLCQLSNGNICIVGRYFHIDEGKLLLMTIDKAGNVIWAKYIENAILTNNATVKVIEDQHHNLLILGINKVNDSVQGVMTKMSSNGNLLWQKFYGVSNDLYFTDILELQKGYLITGFTNSENRADHQALYLLVNQGGVVIRGLTFGGNGYESLVKSVLKNRAITSVGLSTTSGAGNWDVWVSQLRDLAQLEESPQVVRFKGMIISDSEAKNVTLSVGDYSFHAIREINSIQPMHATFNVSEK